MRRKWNWRIYAGFALALAATFSYIPVFTRFSITRDFPWVNLLLYAGAVWLLAAGLYRAFARKSEYRGRVSGIALGAVSLALCGLFLFGVFVFARRLPPASQAVQVGQQAPDFVLAGTDGKPVALSQLRQGNRAVLLIFYRGYW